MAIRVPPGRAGRIWLLRRLEVAYRGADVLDQKRRTLLRERERLAERLGAVAADWKLAAHAAATWNARAHALAGQRRLRLAALHSGAATVTVVWRNVLGVLVPIDARFEPGGTPPDFVALGGGASIALAAEAHTAALSAAAVYAATRAAHDAIASELATTTLRLRAIERRWIPDHEAALKALELTLAENELADIARVRWASERQR
ncbi:MAG: V-type ATP synthase subunit D [Gaiellaceae bacterium]